MRVSIVERTIGPERLVAEVETERCGAVVLFLGTVRDVNGGRRVTGIDYTAYRAMAERELGEIAAEAIDRFPGLEIALEHRLGTLAVGDVSVGIATAHAHRAEAYEANRYLIEQLKQRVPIWKREHYVDGTREWVNSAGPEPAASDGPESRNWVSVEPAV